MVAPTISQRTQIYMSFLDLVISIFLRVIGVIRGERIPDNYRSCGFEFERTLWLSDAPAMVPGTQSRSDRRVHWSHQVRHHFFFLHVNSGNCRVARISRN